MNRSVPSLTHPALWQSLAALVRIGLHRFWQQALPMDSGLPGLLLDEARELLPAGQPQQWEALLDSVQRNWPPRQGALAQLIHDQDLDLPAALLLTLLGEVERSHLISLVVSELHAPDRQPRPTVHLACAWLESLFGRGVISPLSLQESPLVTSRLVRLESDQPLPLKTLRLQPGYWAVLLEQTRGWPQCTLLDDAKPDLLPARLRPQLEMIAELLRDDGDSTRERAGLRARGLILRGYPNSGRRHVAHAIAKRLGCEAVLIPVEMWQQDPALALACRYGRCLPVLEPTLGPGEVWRPGPLPASVPVLILLGSDGAVESPGLLELVLPLPDESQRRRLWQTALHDGAPNPDETLAAHCAQHALLSGPAIAKLGASALLLARCQDAPVAFHHVIQARRQLGAERLRLLAQPVESQIDPGAIVLPPLVTQELERLLDRARLRESLWEGLGTTLMQTRTSGLRALFTGESGTGKTLAASYVASRLGAPLYRVDLSAVMNKYIGESEKNLSALLDMAAASDVVLLFDEADSLFGRRTEGKETGERFANMLTHFLLTRIENHPGIVILTSNNRERIDAAFTRRLDLIVEFPQPGFDERLRLWRSHLGDRGPGEEVYRLLASYCTFAGGQLRNVVLTAAACAGPGPIRCSHLLTGLGAEYRKIGRDLPAKLNQLTTLEPADQAEPRRPAREPARLPEDTYS
ncbi:MAG: ATP-binding protein [Pseudomonadota bacterium]